MKMGVRRDSPRSAVVMPADQERQARVPLRTAVLPGSVDPI
ncbi:hypothetical protein SLNWT_6849 [Streptomyces albus]|uniref:Uncharacterized protein n=1 Tax=Streptomyces albus (strain ATCC 21838 / DSM 41398 / FERM P-419 / JCM 4703 / NBRC 107858) TaxID=1081613 RepID=A0A0B5F6K7_STRA4|nr:hypothetical protein SLNWT_6849 [Streptomyces albus]AOU81529.1 hypothetical protein SLNHY_6838 [Streptomyces albus]AYN37222.1 hypothetical protein DUI70_6729 [Streptomyces albus]